MDEAKPATMGVRLAALPQADYVARLDAGGVLHEVTRGDVVKIPDDATRFTLSCDRTAFPDTKQSVIKCRADISLDDGKTWVLLCSFTTSGGVYREEDGQIVTESSMTVAVPAAVARLVRTSAVFLADMQTRMEVLCR